MFIDLQTFKFKLNSTHPTVTHINNEWCNQPFNKHSTSKWKRLVISLHSSGYVISVKESGPSKYITIADSERALMIRVSNHIRTLPKNPRQTSRWINKFGNTSLLVGPSGVSCKEAFQLIKETLRNTHENCNPLFSSLNQVDPSL